MAKFTRIGWGVIGCGKIPSIWLWESVIMRECDFVVVAALGSSKHLEVTHTLALSESPGNAMLP